MKIELLTAPALLIGALLLGLSGPVSAQSPPPALPTVPMAEGGHGGHGVMGGQGRHGMMGGRGARMFPSVSEAGRAIITEAMRAGADRNEDRARVQVAREKILTLVEADRLDTAAIERAGKEERTAAMASHERRQAAMTAAFAKMSVADRKAFVTDMRANKDRMEQRMRQMRRGMEMRSMGRGAQVPPQPPSN
ncbi:hypothetical protein [Sandarakinorhabdus sp.]|uniref:hypothetical protein n=1 Tax=Sandarakinorhabdus sp. TaxID=1916663 RepID=UPI00286E3728|nr:hypothetical protein [Sandarakinorhabdus sp.]